MYKLLFVILYIKINKMRNVALAYFILFIYIFFCIISVKGYFITKKKQLHGLFLHNYINPGCNNIF